MRHSNISTRSLIKYLCISIVAIYLVNVFFSFKRLTESQVQSFVSYPKISNTYSYIFSAKAMELLQPSYTFYNKQKNPIGTYDVMNGKYQLIVYRMDHMGHLPVKESVKVNWNGDQTVTKNAIYNVSIKSQFIKFGDTDAGPDPTGRLYLNIDAEMIDKPIYADSLISFSLKLNSLTARHNPEDDVTFYVEKNSTLFFKKAPVELVFLKKDKDLYMLLMSPKNVKELPATKHFLYKLLNDELSADPLR